MRDVLAMAVTMRTLHVWSIFCYIHNVFAMAVTMHTAYTRDSYCFIHDVLATAVTVHTLHACGRAVDVVCLLHTVNC